MIIMVLTEIKGTSKISGKNKITLIASVADTLGVTQGDTIVYKSENGRIYIEGGVSNAE